MKDLRGLEEMVWRENWKYWIHHMQGNATKFCEKYGYVDNDWDCEGCTLCIHRKEK